MPFLDADGGPLAGLELRYLGDREFLVEQPFRWVDPRDGVGFDIPAGHATDLASVPAFLWGLVASYGRQTLPAILHDALSDRADDAPAATGNAVRRDADLRFRRALIESGVTALRARTMWTAVALNRYAEFRMPLGILLFVQAIVSIAVIVGGIVLTALGHPWWLLLLPAPAVLAIPWWRDADLVLSAAYLGALYLPLVVAAALSSAIEYVVASVVWIAAGRRGPTPHPGPTLRAPGRPAPGAPAPGDRGGA
jgi:hypothetical protein